MVFNVLKLVSALILTNLLVCSSALAQGDLMILPKRLVFDGTQRAQEISLANTGSDSATYAISMVQYKMTENGSFEEITEAEEGLNFASDYLRYYPRRVVLGPNEAQTVRVQVTKTGSLLEGEYRSHIYFRAVEEQTALGSDAEDDNTESISINIKAVFGISIPVIIRQGVSTTKIAISNVNLNLEEETNPVLEMIVNRNGNMSVYGNLSVKHISSEGKKTDVGTVKGIAIYTPNKLRKFRLPINPIEGVNFNSGRLEITFKSETDKNIYAESLHDLN